MKLDFRELEKALLQYVILPFAYKLFSRKEIQSQKVLFADSKHNGISYNLRSMHQEARNRGFTCIDICYDFEKLSAWQKLCTSIAFMKQYATAKYVFIADYYLPVSSCHKRKGTTVIQLWHASGLQKKFGYDSDEDLRNLTMINPVKNFDLVSVSAECVKQVMEQNWKLPADRIKVLGSSRTDILFDKDYLLKCREKFYSLYPEASGKKIILWAPTFRGKGYKAQIKGVEDICYVKEKLGEDYFFITKLHPNISRAHKLDSCSLNTEELYAVTDLLITDYSSVFYDYLLVKTDVIFFVPDYEEYKEDRGLYIDYRKEFKYPFVRTRHELQVAILEYHEVDANDIQQYKEKFLTMNDGKSSNRIWNCLNGVEHDNSK